MGLDGYPQPKFTVHCFGLMHERIQSCEQTRRVVRVMKKNPVTLQNIKYIKHYKNTVERLLNGHVEERGRRLLVDVQL